MCQGSTPTDNNNNNNEKTTRLPTIMASNSNSGKRIRIRHANGSLTISVPSKKSTTFGEVGNLIDNAIKEKDGEGVPPAKQIWKTGYPPRPHQQVKSTDEFILEDNMISVSSLKSGTDEQQPTILFVLDTKPITETLQTQQLPVMDNDGGGVMVRRVMASDNSCLFHSVCYVLNTLSSGTSGHNVISQQQLRQVVADAIIANPTVYTEAFLGQSSEDYIKFITNPQSWGGQIELSVLSQTLKIEIAALDIVRNRYDIYGSTSDTIDNNNFNQRVYVIYDGIHYDALAYTFDEQLPQDQDVTRFAPTDSGILQEAIVLCQQQHNVKSFTDTSNFALRCIICQKGFVGAPEAEQHANDTGHQNFAEY